MSSKRFTDSGKWKDSWFRKLPVKAKLVWIYLCDECDYTGVWKADYELASFQLGFDFDAHSLGEWFGKRVHLFDQDKALIVPFFKFQYGSSKESFNARICAKNKLEAMGFIISNNEVKIDNTQPTVPIESTDSTSNSNSNSNSKGNSKEGGVGETSEFPPQDLAAIYKAYPRKKGKQAGLKKLRELVKTENDAVQILGAIQKFREQMKIEKRAADKIPYFSTFLNNDLADYLEVEADEDFSEKKTGDMNPDEHLADIARSLGGFR